MTERTVLITGANGEIGQNLIADLAAKTNTRIVALDIHPLDETVSASCYWSVQGNIVDQPLLEALAKDFVFDTIYHMAALLSTSAELNPEGAHRVNIQGTFNLLRMAMEQTKKNNRTVKFLFPSSIAVYGIPDLPTKYQIGKSKEDEWCQPITMYGITKLHCEQLGCYYSDHYRHLEQHAGTILIDFRCLRFPGLISATTMPSGGTSDYLPEMIHYAVQGKVYSCYVREDTRIPFMAMPDAIKALLQLEAAPGQNLKRRVYNVTSFNPSAGEFYEALRREFAHMQLSFEPNVKRQAIVDSWPVDLDDSAARRDWGWEPDFTLQTALETYLIPTIRKRYESVDHAPVV